MEEVKAAIDRMWRRVLLVVGRGRIKTGNDEGPVQRHQVSLGQLETFDDLPRVAEYGFNSAPPENTDAILLFVGGNRTDGVIIGTNHQVFRMRNLAPGEVSISDNTGQTVYLTKSGIVIKGAGKPIRICDTPMVTIDAPIMHVTGDVAIDSKLVAQGDVADHGGKTMAGMRGTYNGHDHPLMPGKTAKPNQPQ
jgi:phage baseplate assembly protein V